MNIVFGQVSFIQYWLFLCTPKIRPQKLRGSSFNFCVSLESYLVWECTFLFSDGDVWFDVFEKYSLQVTQNTNCLYHSSPFLSLVFSSSLQGDPSLLPKLSLPHSSRIADYMQKNNNQTNYNQRMRKITGKCRGYKYFNSSLHITYEAEQPTGLKLRFLTQIAV